MIYNKATMSYPSSNTSNSPTTTCKQIQSIRLKYIASFLFYLTFFLILYQLYAHRMWFDDQTFLWQYTTMGEWLRPVQRQDCSVSTSHHALLPDRSLGEAKEKKNPRIGMVVIYGQFGKTIEKSFSEEIMAPILRNREEYCRRHNYTLINAKDLVDHSRPVSWSKLLAMNHQFSTGLYDYLFYIDMDIVIMNYDIPLEKFIEMDEYQHDIILTEDRSGPNFGVWLAKNTPWTTWFLQTVWNQSQLVPPTTPDGKKYPFNFEQRGVHYLLDTPIWRKRDLPKYPGNSTEIRGHFAFLPQCAFNSYSVHPFDLRGSRELSQYVPGDFLIHFAGKKGERRAQLMNYYLDHVHKGK